MQKSAAATTQLSSRCSPVSRQIYTSGEKSGESQLIPLCMFHERCACFMNAAPRPNSACMGKGVARYSRTYRSNSDAKVVSAAQTQKKETLPKVHRRESFPCLPSHALLGSQLSRESSKSFWNNQMLRNLERKLSHDGSGGMERLPPLPPIQQQVHVPTYPEPRKRSSSDEGRSTLTGSLYPHEPIAGPFRHTKLCGKAWPFLITNNIPHLPRMCWLPKNDWCLTTIHSPPIFSMFNNTCVIFITN